MGMEIGDREYFLKIGDNNVLHVDESSCREPASEP